MRLFKKGTRKEIKVGHKFKWRSADWVVRHLYPPHKPDSSGKVAISKKWSQNLPQTYFVTVFDWEYRD